MKNILLVLTGLCYVVILNARLIEKSTDRTLTTETKTTGSSPPVRLTRQIDDEDAQTGISKEDAGQSDESRSNNRRARHFEKLRSEGRTTRIVRDSQEKTEKTEKTNRTFGTTRAVPLQKQKTLVKKPIPKYNEMDYDDDFQMKISRSPVKVVESGEHEDEDFNLDDYDFDVNHDEFIGRGKPLEPRLKIKDNRERPRPAVKHERKPPTEVKIQSKLVSPVTIRISNKKQRAVELPKKADDYYDDTTTTKAPEKPRDLEDEFNEENEESKEFDGKATNVRMVRSPWKLSYVDKLAEKTSSVMTKVLSILPMFPQVPNKNEDEYSGNDQANDPWTGRQ